MTTTYRTIVLKNDRNLFIYLDFEVLYGRTGIVVGKFAKKETIGIFDAFQALRSIEINHIRNELSFDAKNEESYDLPKQKIPWEQP